MSEADEQLLADLTDDQKAAVVHGEGPLLILAGAGSGKTRVITRRVAYLLSQGIRASNILAITFTNKAAGEMKGRVEKLVPGNKVWVSTFHSLGARLLRQYADRFGIDRNFTIYDMDDRGKLLKDALADADLDNNKFSPEKIGSKISEAKNKLLTPGQYEIQARDFDEISASKVYKIYNKRLRAANAMDFDDLLYVPAVKLRENEELRRDLDARFQYILIDEYQDTNTAQYQIAKLLSQDHSNLCVVGDPDQSVYGWRHADIKNILDFERDFPDTRVITLDRNYRSTKNIIHAANTLIAHNKQRKKKSLVTLNEDGESVRVLAFNRGDDEAEYIAKRIKETVQSGKFAYRDHAVFMRINALSRSPEDAFKKHGVPAQVVRGLSFYDRKEIRDVIAYLRLLVNPADSVAFLRIVNEPTRGIGKVSLDKLQSFADKIEIGLLEAAGRVASIPDIKGKGATGLRDFYKMMTELRAQLDMPPHDFVSLVLGKTGYEAMLRDSAEEEGVDRSANVGELITAVKKFWDEDNTRSISDYIEQMALASDVDGWDDQTDHVSIMTLHASKGLEFPVVYIIAVENGLLPHERSMGKEASYEEERRLCFVGMTRAMKELYLSYAQWRMYRGDYNRCFPSPFIEYELAREVESIQVDPRSTAADEYRAKVAQTLKESEEVGVRPYIPPAKPRTEIRPTIPDSVGPPALEAGVLVQHEQYGLGRVTEVSGYGALRKVRIRFPAIGEKTFVVDQVKLRIVGRKKAEE